MSQNIDRKLKTALDETRLLILGVQILLGFEFQCAFQDRFDRLADGAKQLNLAALGLIVLSVAILIAPSMQHRIVEAGQSTARLILTTNRLASAALMPLTVGLALSAFVVVQLTLGSAAGIAVAAFLGCMSAFCWFGLEILVIGSHRELGQMPHYPKPLKTKIEQLLTEARLIIPGGQHELVRCDGAFHHGQSGPPRTRRGTDQQLLSDRSGHRQGICARHLHIRQ